jgi:Short C-terminal domain
MPGLLRGIARTAVVAGTASHVAGNVQHRQQKKWARKDAEANAPQGYGEQMPAGSSAGSATDDQLEQLQKLGDLKANGILTQAEFEAKKQQILSQ